MVWKVVASLSVILAGPLGGEEGGETGGEEGGEDGGETGGDEGGDTTTGGELAGSLPPPPQAVTESAVSSAAIVRVVFMLVSRSQYVRKFTAPRAAGLAVAQRCCRTMLIVAQNHRDVRWT
jgi:hypothetical protein